MPISSSILYPAMLAAVEQNPDLLDILVELSEDAGATPGAILPPDDPEYLASLNRVNQRMRDHLGWNEINDVDLDESMDSVSLSDFPTTTSQQMPVKPLQEAVKRRCSTTQFLFPDEISQRILALSQRIPDDVLAHSGRTADPHITVKYGLDVVDPDTIRQAIHNYGPVHVRLGKTSIFPAAESSGEYDVVKVDVDSDDLHGLNRVISDAIPHEDTYPDYQPHVTLGYVQPGSGELYAGWNDLEGTECTLNELMFADADKRSTAISLGEGKVHPTAKVDDAIATLDAALNGDVELTGEDLIALLDGLTPDEVAKVRAIYGLAESKGCQSCGKEGIIEVPLDEELDEEELMEADGVTGAKVYKKGGPYKDKNGRIYCLNDQGRRTKCNQQQLDKAKEDFKQQGTSNPDETQGKTALPQQEKPAKPAKQSAEDVHNSIQSMLSEGINDDTVGKIVGALKTLTVKDITAIKQKMGLKASGKKEELISKIAQRAVDGARNTKGMKPVEQSTNDDTTPEPVKDEKPEPVATEPEQPKLDKPKEPEKQSSSAVPASMEMKKDILQKVKEAGDFIPVSIKDFKKGASPEKQKEIDVALLDMIDKGIIFPTRHNHHSALPPEEKAMLLKNPKKDEYYVDIGYVPEGDRAGYSTDGKWTSDEQYFGKQQKQKQEQASEKTPEIASDDKSNDSQSVVEPQQEEKPAEPVEEPKEEKPIQEPKQDSLTPTINTIQKLTRFANAGYSREKLEDELHRLQLHKQSNSNLKHIAKTLGVDLSTYGKNKQSLIDGIKRIPLEVHEMYVGSAG